jgi:hypothetical protein
VLGNFEQIQNFLTCHTFQPIEINFAAHTFQRQPPGITSWGGSFGLRCAYLSYERLHDRLRLLLISEIVLASRVGSIPSLISPIAFHRFRVFLWRQPGKARAKPIKVARREAFLQLYIVLDGIPTEVRCHHAAGIVIE